VSWRLDVADGRGETGAAFDADGRAVLGFAAGAAAGIGAVAHDPAGRLLVRGWVKETACGPTMFTLARYTLGGLSERVWAVTDAAYNIVTITDSAGYALERLAATAQDLHPGPLPADGEKGTTARETVPRRIDLPEGCLPSLPD
jgi:hypothetical protein